MIQQEFVDRLHTVAVKHVEKSLMQAYVNPPGRKPSQRLKQISEWLNNLSSDDKALIQEIISEAAEYSLFNTLSALDGALSIYSIEENCSLELWYKQGDVETLLNGPNAENLHDLMPRKCQ